MTKGAKTSLTLGIILVVGSVIFLGSGITTKALNTAANQQYYGGSSKTTGSIYRDSSSYSMSLNSSTSIPSRTERTYTLYVNTYTSYAFSSDYAVTLTIKSSSGSTVVSKTNGTNITYKSFNSNSYSTLKITVENANSYYNYFYISYN